MTAIAKYRKDENFAEWVVSNYTMEQVEGLITSQEAKLTTLRSELVRLTEKYSHPCPNPMCVGGDNGTPEKCSKCHGTGRIWMLGCESAEVKRLAKELETVGIKYTAMAMHSNPTLRDREIITNLRDDVKRLTKEQVLQLELNGTVNDQYIQLAEQHEAERQAVAEAVMIEIHNTYDDRTRRKGLQTLADRILAGEFATKGEKI